MLSWELLDSLLMQKGCLAGRSLEENPQTQDKHHMSHTAVQSNPKWKLLWCSCLGCLGPLSWAVVRFTVLPSHLQFLCLNIFSTVKWVKNESKTHTIVLWVAWGEVCSDVQIWLCCSHWGGKKTKQVWMLSKIFLSAILLQPKLYGKTLYGIFCDGCCAYLTCILIRGRQYL